MDFFKQLLGGFLTKGNLIRNAIDILFGIIDESVKNKKSKQTYKRILARIYARIGSLYLDDEEFVEFVESES